MIGSLEERVKEPKQQERDGSREEIGFGGETIRSRSRNGGEANRIGEEEIRVRNRQREEIRIRNRQRDEERREEAIRSRSRNGREANRTGGEAIRIRSRQRDEEKKRE